MNTPQSTYIPNILQHTHTHDTTLPLYLLSDADVPAAAARLETPVFLRLALEGPP
jgi:hypothetical protein